MLPFRLTKEARTSFFKDLREQRMFTIDFDAIYFCFIAGVMSGRKKSLPNDKTLEIANPFPGSYTTKGKVLVGLFLSAELKSLGISMDKRKDVHSAISKLLDPQSGNDLSNEGMNEFNKYTFGGFEVLQEWFDDRPRTLESFLRIFHSKIQVLEEQNRKKT